MKQRDLALPDVIEFEWDKWNSSKNRLKHNVTTQECEEVFYNEPLLVIEDILHSQAEKRLQALGKTNKKRTLLIAFTMREEKIRVISARDMNRKEREDYTKSGGDK